MDLAGIFNDISTQMRSDFMKAKKSLTHSGLKGEANEETPRVFLRQYIPKTLDISQGMVVDSKENKTRELDIIISDSSKTPIFFQSGNTRVIPAECIYGAIEVKAFLDKPETTKSHINMLSLKSLNKDPGAYFKKNGIIQNQKTLYGKQWEYWPTHHFVFAYDSNSLKSIVDNLNELQSNSSVEKRIDCICVLNKGVILNRTPDGNVSALPTNESSLAYFETDKALLLFYTMVSVILNQAEMDYFNILPYLGKMEF